MSSFIRRLYSPNGHLALHQGPVLCFAASEDGRLLASGGADGVRIVRTSSGQPLVLPTTGAGRGAVTTLTFIRKQDMPSEEILLIGTHHGYVALWREAHGQVADFEEVNVFLPPAPSKITSIIFEPVSDTMVLSNRMGVIQQYVVDNNLGVHLIFTKELAQVVPIQMAFSPTSGNPREILVWGLYCETLYTLRGTDGEIIKRKNLGGKITHAVVDPRSREILMNEASQGAALYRLGDLSRMMSFPVHSTKVHPRPCQVAFSEDGKTVICGSDHGKVYLFDKWTGECVDALRISDEDTWIQTVASFMDEKGPAIVAARSCSGVGTNPIQLWREKSDFGFKVTGSRILHIVLIFLSVSFLIQNGLHWLSKDFTKGGLSDAKSIILPSSGMEAVNAQAVRPVIEESAVTLATSGRQFGSGTNQPTPTTVDAIRKGVVSDLITLV